MTVDYFNQLIESGHTVIFHNDNVAEVQEFDETGLIVLGDNDVMIGIIDHYDFIMNISLYFNGKIVKVY